jgi:hypothetical protein
MVSAVGPSAYGAQRPSSVASGSSVATLELQIRQDQSQLNDWTTCVSAKTPKGQAAIQKLSGEISAAKERIASVLQGQSGAPPPASPASLPGAQSAKSAPSLTAHAPSRPGSVDIWA